MGPKPRQFFSLFIENSTPCGCFFNAISELLEISTQNSTNVYQKGQKNNCLAKRRRLETLKVHFRLGPCRSLVLVFAEIRNKTNKTFCFSVKLFCVETGIALQNIIRLIEENSEKFQFFSLKRLVSKH